MKKFVDIYFIVLILCIYLFGFKSADAKTSIYTLQEFQENSVPVKIFNDIEKGISTGNVALIAEYFSSQNYLSLNNGVNGYYSSNQSFYVLQDFFNINHPVSFKFSSTRGGGNAYATGTLIYEFKGKKGTALVFISLESSGNTWKISQITIK